MKASTDDNLPSKVVSGGVDWVFDCNLYVDGEVAPAEVASRIGRLKEAAASLGLRLVLLSSDGLFDIPPK